jgi:hypothetical protein
MKSFINLTSIVKVFVLAAFLVTAIQTSAFAGQQDFTFVNNSGYTIRHMYCSATNDWEEDVLGDDVLLNGHSFKLTFPASQTARYWDIKVILSDGPEWYWTGLDLFNISTITLDSSGTIHY